MKAEKDKRDKDTSHMTRGILRNLEGHDGEHGSDDSAEADGLLASAVVGGGGRGGSGGGSGSTNGHRGGGGGLHGAAGQRAGGHGDGSGNTGLGLGADSGGDLSGRDHGGPGSSHSGDGGGGSSGSLGLSLGADGGGLVVNDGDVSLAGAGRSLGCDSGGLAGAGAGAGASGGGDTELGGPLVGAGALNDQEDTVVGGVDGQAGAGGPLVRTGVVDVLNDGLERDNVGAGTTEEDEGDLVTEGGVPLNLEGSALGNLLIQRRVGDGVTLRILGVVGLGVGSSEGREGGQDGSSGETHFGYILKGMTELEFKERLQSTKE